MKIIRYFLIAAIFMQCYSCMYFYKEEPSEPIARVGDAYLTKQVVSNLVNNNLSPEDSAKVVNSYIDIWIEKQVLLQNASDNLTPKETAEVEQKVLEYKESLLSHLYESRLLKERLDTIVEEEELQAYYQSHQQDFVVEEPIVKFFYVKKDSEFENLKNIGAWLNELVENQNDAELKEYCSLQAIDCYTDVGKWVSANQFFETLDMANSTTKVALREGGLIKLKSENYFYLYKLFSVQDNGTYPLNYLKDRIKEVIIRKRKKDFLEQLRRDILESAKNNNEIEIYVE